MRRLAILENRMGDVDRRMFDHEIRLRTAETSTRLAAMSAQQYDAYISAPTFGGIEYRITTVGCDSQPIPNVRVTGDLWWFDDNVSYYQAVGDSFDITSDASGLAVWYGRQDYTFQAPGSSLVTRNVGRTQSGLIGSWYRIRTYPQVTETWWQDPSARWDMILGATQSPPVSSPFIGSGPMEMKATTASQLYRCMYQRGPYPIKNYFTTNGGTFSLLSTPFSTATLATNYGATTWSWNGFAWAGIITGTYTVTWSFSGGSVAQPTLQGWVWRVNPGGGDRPVDVTSGAGGTPARSQLFSAVTSPSSSTGTGSAANWVGSYTYDFTGTTFGTVTGITTVTVTSA